jgi:hypothetical protein
MTTICGAATNIYDLLDSDIENRSIWDKESGIYTKTYNFCCCTTEDDIRKTLWRINGEIGCTTLLIISMSRENNILICKLQLDWMPD